MLRVRAVNKLTTIKPGKCFQVVILFGFLVLSVRLT